MKKGEFCKEIDYRGVLVRYNGVEAVSCSVVACGRGIDGSGKGEVKDSENDEGDGTDD